MPWRSSLLKTEAPSIVGVNEMVIRALGVLVGVLFVGAPFLSGASYVETAKHDPKVLLAQAIGVLFIIYGIGATRLLSRLMPRWTSSTKEAFQATKPLKDPDFQQRLERVTPNAYVTPALIAINVIVFAAMVANGAGVATPDPRVHLLWGSNFGPLTMNGQWWRVVTATFLHFGVLHLALNMWALYENGRIVERLYGSLYFLALYLFSGVTGSLTSLFWHPTVNSAGASGAIFGVLGALIAFMLTMHGSIPLSVRNAQRNSTLLFVAYALISGFSTPGIDNAAHLGGLAGGFLAGLFLARPLDPEQRRSGGARRLASVAMIGMAGILVSLPLLRSSTVAVTYLIRAASDLQSKDFDAAIADATRAIEIDPTLVQAHLLRAAAKGGKGDLSAVIGDATRAIEIDPKLPEGYVVRASANLDKGDLSEAISDASLALQLDPKLSDAYGVRGMAKSRRGDFKGAIDDLSDAIKINPEAAPMHNELAWIFATAAEPAFRDGRRAVESALRACELSQWKNASSLDTLAAAYARNGEFKKAIEWQRKATADSNLKQHGDALKRLELYQAGKAWPPD